MYEQGTFRMTDAMNDTGKRRAARNNSGQTVDHSVPDLGVGPTTPATSGRNPEACPPDFQSSDNSREISSDSSRREALDSSQGKSGGARARATLRSEAEQRTSYTPTLHD